jgi:hypothetical protein
MSIHSLLVALSHETDLDQALVQLQSQLDKASSPGKFAVVFCTPDYPASELAAGLQSLLSETPWIGMSVPAPAGRRGTA